MWSTRWRGITFRINMPFPVQVILYFLSISLLCGFVVLVVEMATREIEPSAKITSLYCLLFNGTDLDKVCTSQKLTE